MYFLGLLSMAGNSLHPSKCCKTLKLNILSVYCYAYTWPCLAIIQAGMTLVTASHYIYFMKHKLMDLGHLELGLVCLRTLMAE